MQSEFPLSQPFECFCGIFETVGNRKEATPLGLRGACWGANVLLSAAWKSSSQKATGKNVPPLGKQPDWPGGQETLMGLSNHLQTKQNSWGRDKAEPTMRLFTPPHTHTHMWPNPAPSLGETFSERPPRFYYWVMEFVGIQPVHEKKKKKKNIYMEVPGFPCQEQFMDSESRTTPSPFSWNFALPKMTRGNWVTNDRLFKRVPWGWDTRGKYTLVKGCLWNHRMSGSRIQTTL